MVVGLVVDKLINDSCCVLLLGQVVGVLVNDANVVLFLNNHPGLMNFPFDMLRDSTKRPLLIFDSWHNVKFSEDSFDSSDSSGITFLRVGDGA